MPTGGRATVAPGDDLLLRETNHRCSNDLQLVVGLLALQARRADHPEVRRALADAMERVAVLARARRVLHDQRPQGLNAALQQVCDALHAQAEPRLVAVVYVPGEGLESLSAAHVTTLALVVNELATNAIKHAFAEGSRGRVGVSAAVDERGAVVIVDDDGSPFPAAPGRGDGLGMSLATRMMAAVDGLFIPPSAGSKMFQLRVPMPRLRGSGR